MKKLTVIILAACAVVLSSCSCGQQNKKAKNTAAVEAEMSQAEKYVTEDLKISMDQLVASLSQLKETPVVSKTKSGEFKLSDKEKMVKPNYLLAPDAADKCVTLTQKYRAVAVYEIDRTIANLYGMSTTDIDAAAAKLVQQINDPALEDLCDEIEKGDFGEALNKFYDAEFENRRMNFFWETFAASLIEQVFVMTKNIDKFMTCFDDQAASDISYRFVLVQEGIKNLIPFHPEMESLDEVLKPLYVLNACNVEQLRDQLIELKGEITVVRARLFD